VILGKSAPQGGSQNTRRKAFGALANDGENLDVGICRQIARNGPERQKQILRQQILVFRAIEHNLRNSSLDPKIKSGHHAALLIETSVPLLHGQLPRNAGRGSQVA
jgi:hypothetical protein